MPGDGQKKKQRGQGQRGQIERTLEALRADARARLRLILNMLTGDWQLPIGL